MSIKTNWVFSSENANDNKKCAVCWVILDLCKYKNQHGVLKCSTWSSLEVRGLLVYFLSCGMAVFFTSYHRKILYYLVFRAILRTGCNFFVIEGIRKRVKAKESANLSSESFLRFLWKQVGTVLRQELVPRIIFTENRDLQKIVFKSEISYEVLYRKNVLHRHKNLQVNTLFSLKLNEL